MNVASEWFFPVLSASARWVHHACFRASCARFALDVARRDGFIVLCCTAGPPNLAHLSSAEYCTRPCSEFQEKMPSFACMPLTDTACMLTVTERMARKRAC